MKHFFFPYDESSLSDLLEKYVYCSTEGKDEGTLKAYYDITDIIYDKRLDQSDEQLKNLLTYFEDNKKEFASTLNKNEPGFKGEHLRLRGLKLLWYDIEQQYKKLTADKSILQNTDRYGKCRAAVFPRNKACAVSSGAGKSLFEDIAMLL